VSQGIGLSRSDREFPALTGRSGTQRARRPGAHTTAGISASWSSSPSSELRITSVFSRVARRFEPRAIFAFTSWRRRWLLAVDGGSGTSRGHVCRELLIHSFPYRRPAPPSSVRDLGGVPVGRPPESGEPGSCSSVWLPARLPSSGPLIRRSGPVVHNRLRKRVSCGQVPARSVSGGWCSRAWQQCWQQFRWR
jgi:hypothetical protein